MKNTIKPDSVLKDYWRNNDRFSDLFNQVFFHGEAVINPGQLADKDTEESAVIIDKKQDNITSISRACDIIKEYSDNINLILIGLENQMHVHYGMPVRTMLYEALDYTKQCKDLEQQHRAEKDLTSSGEFLSGMAVSDKIKAAVTLIVYYGEKPWDGPESLEDMMNIPPAFQPLFNNYNIRLLQVKDTETFHFKNQDNEDFFALLREFYYNEDKLDINKFKENHPDLDIYWETAAALGAVTGTTELIEYALSNKGGRIHMCTALENLKQEGIQEGIHNTIIILRDLDIKEDVILLKIQKQFKLSKEEALRYLKN